MIDSILLTQNANFYKRIKKITDECIEDTFISAISEKKKVNIKLRIQRELDAKSNIRYSILMFEYEDYSSSRANEILKEKNIAYLLIIEHTEYIAISKHNISDFLRVFENVEHQDLDLS